MTFRTILKQSKKSSTQALLRWIVINDNTEKSQEENGPAFVSAFENLVSISRSVLERVNSIFQKVEPSPLFANIIWPRKRWKQDKFDGKHFHPNLPTAPIK